MSDFRFPRCLGAHIGYQVDSMPGQVFKLKHWILRHLSSQELQAIDLSEMDSLLDA